MTPLSAIVVGNESLLRHCTQRLLDRGHEVRAVITRDPDLTRWATDAGLRVEHQDAAPASDAPTADWLFSIANLSILPSETLARGGLGAINFHDGPLPRMAGINAPVWAIARGHDSHGIAWHLIDGGIDEGDLLVTRDIPVDPRETALTLNAKCFAAAADSFDDLLDMMETGAPIRRAQDLAQRSYLPAALRPRAGGLLDLRRPAAELDALVRAMDHGDYWNPLAIPRVALPDRLAMVRAAEPVADGAPQAVHEPGVVLGSGPDFLVVTAGDGALRLTLHPADRGALPAAGARLPLPDDAEIARLDALTQPAARNDAWWRRRIERLKPALIHGAESASDDCGHQPLSADGPVGLAAVVWALMRMDGRAEADLAVRPQNAPDARDLLAARLPLRVDLAKAGNLKGLADLIDTALAEIAPKGMPLADLTQRAPELRDQTLPRIGFDLAPGGPPLDLWAIRSESGWILHWNRGAVRDDTARMIAAAIDRTAGMTGDTALAELSLMTAADRNALLIDRNDSAMAVPDGCIHDLIKQAATRDPDATALVFQDRTLTRAELDRASAALAVRLQALGVGPDQPVGLFARRSAEMVIGALAILRAGGAYVPLDPDYPADRLAHYLSDSGAQIVLVQRGLSGALPEGDAMLVPLPTEIPAQTTTPAPAAGPDNLAYLIYTSGSTGTPKGVMVEHRNVVNFFAGIDATIPAAEGDALLAVTSLSFDISVLEIFWSLARGLKVVLVGDDARLASGGGAPSGGMDFSLFYWGNDDGPGPQKYQLLLDGARFADQNGFVAVYTPERHFHAFGGPYPNPAVTGAAVAAVTSRIAVRAGSCVLPLHHPARVAEEWAVIDNLTAGRTGLALASGWQPDDFVLRPENAPPGNKQALSDGIDQLRRLWRGETVEFPATGGKTHTVVTQPRPVQAELPLWLTIAGNPESWIEAGRRGLNVLTHLLGQSIDIVAERIRDYHGALREAGYDPRDFTVTLMLHSYLADTREQARDIAREPMKAYLRSAAALVKQYAWDFPAFRRPAGMSNPMAIDLGSLTEDEMDGILEFAFLRYFEDSGLFGTVDDALARVGQLQEIGVTEIACLIDYGIAPAVVMESLPRLAELRTLANQGDGAPADDDFSIAAQVVRHGVTHLQCTPSMASILTGDPAATRALGRLKCLMIGGESLPFSLLSDLRQATDASIFNMYGPTETTVWSSVSAITPDDQAATLAAGFANTQLYVLDETGRAVPDGAEGELWIGGHGVTRGYWQRPEQTDHAFRPDPYVTADRASPGGSRMYRTGDLVRWRPDGRMDYVGRADHQVKLRGFRIELGEIETRLAQLSGVREAVAIVREDAPGDQRLVAYVTGPSVPDEAKMRAALVQSLPAHMLPGRIVTLDRLPLTPNLKIDRKALPPPDAAIRAVVAAPPPASAPVKHPTATQPPRSAGALLAEIRAIWGETLGNAQPKASDNFFASGGHSLLAIQLHRTLRDRLGLSRLSVTDIFRFPVLGDYAAHAESVSPRPNGGGDGATSPPPAAPVARPAASVGTSAEPADPIARRRALREQFRRGL